MNPFLFTFYHSVKTLVRTVFRIYFSKTVIINRERLGFKHPAIIVSNHPNTLLDPLNVAIRVKKIVFFLANAGLFKNRFLGWFLNTFYCIPIERPQDVDGRKIKNADSFERCNTFLSNGGCLYIAAEGVSNVEWQVRRIKTGTARIALSAERSKNFELGMAIIPVGLTYMDPTDFRSEMIVHVGEPIAVKDYQVTSEENSFATAKQISKDIEAALQKLTLHTRSIEEETLARQMQTFQQTDYPLELSAVYERSKQNLQTLHLQTESENQEIQQSFSVYFDFLKKERLNDLAVKSKGVSAIDFLKLIIGFPFFLYGGLNNLLAFFVPSLLARSMNVYIGYQSTIKTMAGVITLPLFFGIQTWLVARSSDLAWLPWVYLLTLLPLGLLAWEYRSFAQQFFRNWRWQNLSSSSKTKLSEQRKALSEMLTSFLIQPVKP